MRFPSVEMFEMPIAVSSADTDSSDRSSVDSMQARGPTSGDDRVQPWEFTLGASGSNDEDFEAGDAQLSASVFYYVVDSVKVGARQNLWFADAGNGISDIWNGSSRFAIDYVFPSHWVRPFLGVSIGAVYGDTIKESLVAAPEAGVQFFIKSDVFIQAIAEYQFLFETSDRINDVIENGQFVYGLNLGCRF